ncbi:formyltetrahydrofolate deformylase [Puniceicoccus vermicola]|uniref:Formyltetrahydrofolate deformylase n=1 Tax=Puniceicoccus vermicola TaxID=388746 RepID=A0A7X1AUY8_9BACT|nr:formyltetrahydrofolate deformylase [Puniceicoccus vermicola]MBC2600174.1 formyltetrahydrofolate deformylase [Puniceicoccus vermicola]
MSKIRLIALLSGPDRPGIVARVSGWIFERGGNILHADQHQDPEEHIFFQRVEWVPTNSDSPEKCEAEGNAFADFATRELGMKVQVSRSDVVPRIALFVSKIPHCFHDVLLRAQAGEFHGEVACILSNHETLRKSAESYGIPFHHIPIGPRGSEERENSENEQVRLCREYQVDVVVLARYMQVLSAELLQRLEVPVINIHHSFLPAFAGGKPYHQAYARGVKLIGATAHYATADLDEGPIIHQDVSRVNHRDSVSELTRRGRDLEKTVLAQAIRWHLDSRILVYHNKTVVFH